MKPASKRIAPGSKVSGPPSSRIVRGRAPATELLGAPRSSSLQTGPPRSSAVIFGVATAVIALVIGILLLVQSGQADPVKIKAELKAKIDEVDKKFSAEQVILKDEALHPILEVKRYQKYGGDVYANLDKAHRSLHELAVLQKAADAEVPSFLNQAGAVLADPKSRDDQVTPLLEKGRSLLNKFGGSLSGDKLKGTVVELGKMHDNFTASSPAGDYVQLQMECIRLLGRHEFLPVPKIIDEYELKWREKIDEIIAGKIAGLRNNLTHAVDKYVAEILSQADRLHQNNQESEARRIVDQAIPQIEGFESQARLRAFLR